MSRDFTKSLQVFFKPLTTGWSPSFSLDLMKRVWNGSRPHERKIMRIPITLLALFAQAATAMAAAGSAPLRMAHESYLRQNDEAMLSSMVEVLRQSPSQVEKDNLRALLTKAFEKDKGILKTSARLPDGLLDLSIEARRTQEKGDAADIVEVKGELAPDAEIKTIELSRYPGQEIVSTNNNHHEFKITNKKERRFYLKNRSAGPLPDGLYRLVVVMKNGESIDQLLPLIDLVSAETPRILEPMLNETTLNRNLDLRWQPAAPLKPLAYENRVRISAVVNDPPDYSWDEVWGLSQQDISRSSVTIGREPTAEGVSELKTGNYVLVVSQKARRAYGVVRVVTLAEGRVRLQVR